MHVRILHVGNYCFTYILVRVCHHCNQHIHEQNCDEQHEVEKQQLS